MYLSYCNQLSTMHSTLQNKLRYLSCLATGCFTNQNNCLICSQRVHNSK